ncbi:MAG: hypothetical protein NTW86_32310 [Candidatus Sumerlaeota bacterium]|nr:hypothetical protein [Candidatus Sumerlaeota bacterium]
MMKLGWTIARLAIAGALGAAALALAALASGDATARRHIEAASQWLAARQPERAEAELRAGRALFPDEPNGLELGARLLILRDDNGAAEAALRRAAACSAQPGAALRALGKTLADEPGGEARGAEALERSLQLSPPPSRQEAGMAWLSLGQAALSGGDPGRAAWALRRAQEAGAPGRYLAPALVQAYERLGLRDAAAVIRTDPTLAPRG